MNSRHLTKINLLFFCLLGTLLRVIYSYYYTPWRFAPDHLAWESMIRAGGFSYAELIHYPHEGGTILVSLLSKFLGLFTAFNSLTLSAILLDFISRFIQLYIVSKTFPANVTLAFGLWSIFASPSSIPWGSLNFGMHAVSSSFPFLLFYVFQKNKGTARFYTLSGMFMGFAVWFSYTNLVLLPAYLVLLFFAGNELRFKLYALFSFVGLMFLHLLVRLYADAGFHLEQIPLDSIRDTSFSFSDAETWKRLYKLWTNALADSSIAARNSPYFVASLKYIWISLVGIGLLAFLRMKMPELKSGSKQALMLMVFTFLLVYAISPFYYEGEQISNHVAYRHLCYILPLLSLLVIAGLNNLRTGVVLWSLYLVFAVYGCVLLFTQKPPQGNGEKAAGWVLCKKIGHDPVKVQEVIQGSSLDHSLLYQGIGWGMSSALFENVEANNKALFDERLKKFKTLFMAYPMEYRDELKEGAKFSFGDGITPVLDKAILEILMSEM
jgi:hypothetical protein